MKKKLYDVDDKKQAVQLCQEKGRIIAEGIIHHSDRGSQYATSPAKI
ncbi:hypothetical protein [Bacillus cereus]|nr:hypothetical protein [Bacillus cereus]